MDTEELTKTTINCKQLAHYLNQCDSSSKILFMDDDGCLHQIRGISELIMSGDEDGSEQQVAFIHSNDIAVKFFNNPSAMNLRSKK